MTSRHRMTTQLKAVVIRRGKVLLARCTHDQQWELPGGPADPDAVEPAAVLAAQIRAETGQAVLVGPEIYDFQLQPPGGTKVQMLAFGCHLQGRLPLQISEKYRQVAWLPVDELPEQHLDAGYVTAIRAWHGHPEHHGSEPSDLH